MTTTVEKTVIGAVTGVIGAVALGIFAYAVKPADAGSPSMRQQVLAAKVERMREARMQNPSFNTARSAQPHVDPSGG